MVTTPPAPVVAQAVPAAPAPARPSQPERGCLIGADWGSSSLRLYLLGDGGRVLQTRASAQGASTALAAQPGGHARILAEATADWRQAEPSLQVIACGMVGSRHGWLDVPYLDCPADALAVGAALATVEAAAPLRVRIVAGLIDERTGRMPDVMRGEETQVFGALQQRPELAERCCMVLPGTHSKWVQVRAGAVAHFVTHMTGELYAVLAAHSVLGRLLPQQAAPANDVATPHDSAADDAAFLRGVDAARDGDDAGLGSLLFSVRTLGLTGVLNGAEAQAYLSGLLIGAEVRAGLIWRRGAALDSAPLALIGEPALLVRYVHALRRFGVDADADAVLSNTAAAGLWQIWTHTPAATASVPVERHPTSAPRT